MAAQRRQPREGEVWVDCPAVRRLYDEARHRIPALNKLLSDDGFGSGPLSRIRGMDQPKQGLKPATKMRRENVATFAKICGIPVDQLLIDRTGEHPPADTEGPTIPFSNPTILKEGPTPPNAHRAWIRIVRAEIASPLIFTADESGRLAVKFLLRNAGNAPASFVTTASMIIPFEAERSPRDTLDAVCEQQPGEGQGFTLFPGEERDWTDSVVMEPAAIERVKKALDLTFQKANVLFAGCVTYRSAGNKTIHKTPYLYEVYQTINAELAGFDFTESVIDPKKLSLHPEARWLREPT